MLAVIIWRALLNFRMLPYFGYQEDLFLIQLSHLLKLGTSLGTSFHFFLVIKWGSLVLR